MSILSSTTMIALDEIVTDIADDYSQADFYQEEYEDTTGCTYCEGSCHGSCESECYDNCTDSCHSSCDLTE